MVSQVSRQVATDSMRALSPRSSAQSSPAQPKKKEQEPTDFDQEVEMSAMAGMAASFVSPTIQNSSPRSGQEAYQNPGFKQGARPVSDPGSLAVSNTEGKWLGQTTLQNDLQTGLQPQELSRAARPGQVQPNLVNSNAAPFDLSSLNSANLNAAQLNLSDRASAAKMSAAGTNFTHEKRVRSNGDLNDGNFDNAELNNLNLAFDRLSNSRFTDQANVTHFDFSDSNVLNANSPSSSPAYNEIAGHSPTGPRTIGDQQGYWAGGSYSALSQQAAPMGQVQIGRGSWNKNLSGGEFVSMRDAVHAGKGKQSEISPEMDPMSPFGSMEDFNNLKKDTEESKSIQSRMHGKEDVYSSSINPQSLQGHQAQLGTQLVTGAGAAAHGPVAQMPDVSAYVIPGTMARGRISTAGLMSMSEGIQKASLQGGGEMRVRLKPEHLGELNVRVMTDGNKVGLEIHASDEKSKKIIEESLSYLKESLSAQHLTLSHVDLSVSGSPLAHRGDESGTGFRDNSGQNTNLNQHHQGQGQSNPWFSNDSGQSPRGSGMRSQSAAQAFGGASRSAPGMTPFRPSDGRLDVMA